MKRTARFTAADAGAGSVCDVFVLIVAAAHGLDIAAVDGDAVDVVAGVVIAGARADARGPRAAHGLDVRIVGKVAALVARDIGREVKDEVLGKTVKAATDARGTLAAVGLDLARAANVELVEVAVARVGIGAVSAAADARAMHTALGMHSAVIDADALGVASAYVSAPARADARAVFAARGGDVGTVCDKDIADVDAPVNVAYELAVVAAGADARGAAGARSRDLARADSDVIEAVAEAAADARATALGLACRCRHRRALDVYGGGATRFAAADARTPGAARCRDFGVHNVGLVRDAPV